MNYCTKDESFDVGMELEILARKVCIRLEVQHQSLESRAESRV